MLPRVTGRRRRRVVNVTRGRGIRDGRHSRRGAGVKPNDWTEYQQLLQQTAFPPDSDSSEVVQARLKRLDALQPLIRQQIEQDIQDRRRKEMPPPVPTKVTRAVPSDVVDVIDAELPLDMDESVPIVTNVGDNRQTLMRFLERLWQDQRLRSTVCWLFPSAAMAEYKAVISLDRDDTIHFDGEHIQKRLEACNKAKTTPSLVFFTIVYRDSYQMVLIDRNQRTVDTLWVGGTPADTDLHGFLRLNVLNRLIPLSFTPSAYKTIEQQCHNLFPSADPPFNSPFWCGITESAFLYMRLLQPSLSSSTILTQLQQRGPSYLRQYARFVHRQTQLPAFRNVPLAEIADFSTYRKYSQSTDSMVVYLEYIAHKLTKEEKGNALVCLYTSSLGDAPIRIVDPRLRQQYPSLQQTALSSTVALDLLNQIDACAARFFIVRLRLLLARSESTTPVNIPPLPSSSAGVSSFVESVGSGHANVMIFDNGVPGRFEPTAYRFEPNGPATEPRFVRIDEEADTFVTTQVLPKLKRRYVYSTGVQSCPYIPGAQALQTHTGKGGYCVSWSLMFAVLRLLNPEWSVDRIQERMTNAGLEHLGDQLKARDRGPLLLQYIQKFTKATDCVVPDFARVPPQLSTHMAIRRLMRQLDLLSPVNCGTGVGIEPRGNGADWDQVFYYRTPKQDVFLAARTTCGLYVTGPPFDMAGQVTRDDVQRLTTQVYNGKDTRVMVEIPLYSTAQPGALSDAYRGWEYAAKAAAGTGDGSLVKPYRADETRFADHLSATVQFYLQRIVQYVPALSAKDSTCPAFDLPQ